MNAQKKNYKIWLVFILVGIWLSGCSPRYFGVFVNSTSQPRVVILLDEQEKEILQHCVVNPGRQTKMEIRIGVLKAFDISGSPPIQHKLSLLDPKHTYGEAGERETYYLLTETGIYPIPKAYRSNWTNHLAEITKHSGDL